jgi:hypothetical protein
MKVPLKTVVTDRSCSLMARVITARTDKKTRFKDDEDIPRSNRKSLTRPASDTSIFHLQKRYRGSVTAAREKWCLPMRL